MILFKWGSTKNVVEIYFRFRRSRMTPLSSAKDRKMPFEMAKIVRKTPFKVGKIMRKTFNFHRLGSVKRKSNCGIFDKLPIELLHHIFELLTLSDIGQLSLTSEAFGLKITDWIWTLTCLKRSNVAFTKVFLPNFSPMSPIPAANAMKNAIFKVYMEEQPKLNEFGVLCKRLTCLSHTSCRVSFAFTAFESSLKKHWEVVLSKQPDMSVDWIKAMHLVQFMKMLHTFMRGWDESEFKNILQQINKSFDITIKLSTMIDTPDVTTVDLNLEMTLRLLLRSLVWDLVGDDYALRASWVLTTMKHFVGDNVKSQAIFLLIAFGYTCDDTNDHYTKPDTLSYYQRNLLEDIHNHTDWECYGELPPDDFHDGKKMFYSLAQAICCCMSYSIKWKEEMLSKVLRKIFSTPKPWLLSLIHI